LVAYALPLIFSSFQIFQFTMVICFGVALTGLNLLIGYAGVISVASGAFFGVGAYTTLLLATRLTSSSYDFSPYAYLSIPLAALLSFAAGCVVGLPVARLRGWNLALLTIGVAVAFPPLVLRWSSLTHGSNGLYMAKPVPPGWTGLDSDQWIYYLTLVVATAVFLSYRSIVNGGVGRALLAMKDNELAARALGVDVPLYRVLVFGLSAAATGIAGALYGLIVQNASPDSFDIMLSITLLLGVVVGGLGSVAGPLIGAIFLEFMRQYAEVILQSAINFVYGALLILTMLIAPRGIAGLPDRLRQARRFAFGQASLRTGASRKGR